MTFLSKKFAVTIFFTLCSIFFLFNFFFFAGNFHSIQEMLDIPPCFRIARGKHHYFEPNCQGIARTFNVRYFINEDGLRERPKKRMEKNKKVLLLGDSHVEGWKIPWEKTLGLILEKNTANKKKDLRFINAGIRSSGTIYQSLRLQELIEKYQPQKVLWFLNENDSYDDKIHASMAIDQDTFGPNSFSTEDFAAAKYFSFFRELPSPAREFFGAISVRLYQWKVLRLMAEADEKGHNYCSGLERGLSVLKQKKVPVQFVILPLAGMGKPAMREDFQKLLVCIPQENILDLRGRLSRDKGHFFPKESHMNATGVSALAEILWNTPKLIP